MIPKSITIPKLLILLTLNLTFLNQSHASNRLTSKTKPNKHHPKAHSPSHSPLSKSHFTPDYEYEEFLEECQRRMTSDCAEQIVGNLFHGEPVNGTCCSKLINMGPDCHKELLNREKLLKHDHEKETQKMISKSEHLWKKCEKIAGPVDGDDYPKLPRRRRPDYEEFLRNCGREMTEKCGEEVVAALYGGGEVAVDKKCCSKLLDMGDECHREMVERLMELSEVNRKEVKKRSGQVWEYCETIGK